MWGAGGRNHRGRTVFRGQRKEASLPAGAQEPLSHPLPALGAAPRRLAVASLPHPHLTSPHTRPPSSPPAY